LLKVAATPSRDPTVRKKPVNMHRYLLYGFALLCTHASATVIRQQIISEFESCDVSPAWERTNDLNIVPLTKGARTGLVAPEVEEGLIYALGPRFANVFIDNAKDDHAEDLNCIFKCAGNVIKLAPCIATAVATENPLALLNCGVGKSTVCDCGKCLPDSVSKFVGQFCSSSTLPASAKGDEMLSYPDWIQFSQRAPYLQGFRGDLKKTVLDEAKGLVAANKTKNGGFDTQDGIFGFCPGTICGGCGCCVGLCVLGTCAGGCI